MAGYLDRINVIIDVSTSKAVTGLKDFRTAVKDADGFTGKLKAGFGSLKSSGPALAGALGTVGAAIGGIATAAFAAGDKFVNLARQSRDLGTATGLTTEEASRLIEVFGDLGGDAGSLQAALGKIPKTLESGTWEKYGVATKTAGGRIRSTNDILLDALQALREIEDPTRRAQAGVDLFGKSWGTLAPLINKSDGALREMLGTVSDGKTITDAEVKRAEDLAAAQDALGDAFDDITLAVGEMVTELAPAVSLFASALGIVTDAVASLNYEYTTWAQRQKDVKGTIGEQREAINNQRRAVYLLENALKNSKPALVEYGDANKVAASAAYETEKAAQAAADALAKNRDSLARAAHQAEYRLSQLRSEIEGRKSWADLQLSIMGTAEQLADLTKQYEDEEITAEEYALKTASLQDEARLSLLDYLTEVEKVPAEKATAIVANLSDPDVTAWLADVQTELDKADLAVSVGVNPYGRIPGAFESGLVISPTVGLPTGMGEYRPAAAGGNTYINVSGALDAVAVATQVRNLLNQDRARRGLPPL